MGEKKRQWRGTQAVIRRDSTETVIRSYLQLCYYYILYLATPGIDM